MKTVEEMRTELNLGPEVSDPDVVETWLVAHEAEDPAELITLAEAKAHLRVTNDTEDDLIQGMLDAAIAVLDGPQGWLGRSLYRVTRAARVTRCGRTLRIPYPPVVEVVTIERMSSDVWSVLDAADWTFEDDQLRLASSYCTSWTRGEEYRVVYEAGYEALPKPLRAAVLIMVEDMFRRRGSTADGIVSAPAVSTTVEALTAPFRVFS